MCSFKIYPWIFFNLSKSKVSFDYSKLHFNPHLHLLVCIFWYYLNFKFIFLELLGTFLVLGFNFLVMCKAILQLASCQILSSGPKKLVLSLTPLEFIFFKQHFFVGVIVMIPHLDMFFHLSNEDLWLFA